MILNGKNFALAIEKREAKKVKMLTRKGIIPRLAVILVGDDPASLLYVSKKREAGKRMGVEVDIHQYKNISNKKVIQKIEMLNRDKKIHGIIVQFPLPENLDSQKIIESVSPEKDVDGLHPLNWGRLAYKKHELIPSTPAAVLEILKSNKIKLQGQEVVIVGKGNITGKPLSILLLNEDSTLTIVHAKTKNLKQHTIRADILISATGSPLLIKNNMVKKGAVVIDIGISKKNKKVIGDVDFNSISKKAFLVTPVPGGVGPITVAMLLKNVVKMAQRKG